MARRLPPSPGPLSAARQLLHAILTARFEGSVDRSGEPIAAIGTLLLDHAWHRLPRLGVDCPRCGLVLPARYTAATSRTRASASGKRAASLRMSGTTTRSASAYCVTDFLPSCGKRVPGLTVNGDQASRHPGNLNLLFPSIDASLLLQNLHPTVAASTGSACTSGQPEPSHVLRAIGLSAKDANASIRFSIGRFTTESDVDDAADHVGKTCKLLAASAPVSSLT